jgi:quinol monooxygenase YgiN
VSTLEPKDGRRDELVELLAELAKHIRGEPGYLQYSVHRPLGEDKGPLLVIQRYTSLEAYQEHSSWARGQAPRISELLATPPAPPVLFEPVPLGTTRRSNGGSAPQRVVLFPRDEEGTDRRRLAAILVRRRRAGHRGRFLCRSHGDDHRTTPVQPPTSRQHGTGWPAAGRRAQITSLM